MRCYGLAGVVAVVLAAGARAEDKPELTYKQDGNDLVVSLKVRANNSEHALVAWTEGGDKELTLRYVLVQNPDAFHRSLKWVTAEWRLAGKKEADVKVKGVDPAVLNLKTADLKGFAEQVQKVAEAGEKKGG
jgi:hypothetical protein